MRELGRGGSLVAATIAALHSRSAVDVKLLSINSRPTIEEDRNGSQPSREAETEEACSRRVSEVSERPLSTASETSERDSVSVHSSEEPPPQEST